MDFEYQQPNRLRTFVALLSFAVFLSGCSVLVGNIRPVEEPASIQSQPSVVPVLDQRWKLVDSPRNDQKNTNSQPKPPELNYQNEKTGSTLAFTSGCRKSYQKSPPSLRMIAQSLGSGLSRILKREQNETIFRGVPALETKISGMAEGSELTIHNLVTARMDCVFDLTLVSLSRHYSEDLPAFHSLLDSLPFPR